MSDFHTVPRETISEIKRIKAKIVAIDEDEITFNSVTFENEIERQTLRNELNKLIDKL